MGKSESNYFVNQMDTSMGWDLLTIILVDFT